MKRVINWALPILFFGLGAIANAQGGTTNDLYARLDGSMRVGSPFGTPSAMVFEYFISNNRMRMNLEMEIPGQQNPTAVVMILEVMPDTSVSLIMQLGATVNPIRILMDRALVRDVEAGMFGYEERDSATNDYRTIDNVPCRKLIRFTRDVEDGKVVTQRIELWYPVENSLVFDTRMRTTAAAVMGSMVSNGVPMELNSRREQEGVGTIYIQARMTKQKRKRLPSSTWTVSSRLQTIELTSEQFREQLSREAGMQDL